MSDTLPKMEKYPHEKLSLDGSNYSQWATGFKMWAGGLSLWSYISGEEQEPSPPAPLSDPDQNIIRNEKHAEKVKVFKQRRLLALSALSTAIDAQDFVYLRDVNDPLVGWTSLANKYLPQKTIRFNQYLDRLFTISKASDSTSISQTLQLLVVLKADLAALASSLQSTSGTSGNTPPPSSSPSPSPSSPPSPSLPSNEYKIPDAIFVHVLLCALPDYYNPFHQTLVNSTTPLDFNDVVNRLKTQELHRAGTGATVEHIAMLSGHRRGSVPPPKGERVAPKGFDESKGDGWMMGWRPKCGHCSKVGHIWALCHGRLPKEDKAPKSASPLHTPTSTDTDIPLAGKRDEDAPPPFLLTLNDHSASISSTLDVPSGSFHVDSASTAHMEPEKSHFSHYTKLREPIRVTLADNHVVMAPGWGTVNLMLRHGTSLTERAFEFLHVPDLRCTLISVSMLASAHIAFITDSRGGQLRLDDGLGPWLATVSVDHGLYLLDAAYTCPRPHRPAIAMLTGTKSLPAALSLDVWHRRLGHAGFSTITKAVGHVLGLRIDPTSHHPQPSDGDTISCVSCVMGKQRRLPFSSVARRANVTAELIHSDVWGPVDILSSTGDSYFVVFTDDYTRYSVVYLMRHKSDVFDCFKRFLPWIETQSGERIKHFRSDNGGEYVSHDFLHYLTSHGIEHETTMPYTPQQNGVAERGHQTVVTRALSSHHLSGFPRSFWGWAILNSAHICNVLPSSALAGRTPFEAFYGRRPSVDYLRPFGALAYAHIPDETRHKYTYVSRRCFLLGHVRNAGYILWDPAAKRTVCSRHVVFDECVFYGDPSSSSPLRSLIPSTPLMLGPPVHIPALTQPSVGASAGEPPVLNPADPIVSQASVGGPVVPAPTAPPSVPAPEPQLPQTPATDSLPRRSTCQRTAPHANISTAIPTRRVPVAERWTYEPIPADPTPTPPGPGESAMHTSADTLSIPKSIHAAQSSPQWPQWSDACKSELKSMHDLRTHRLVLLPAGRKAIGSRWVFTIKTDENGNLLRHKARLVAQGFTQVEGIDYTETFAAVAKYDTVRILLALAAKFDLELDQMDVRTAFLNADLKEDIYLKQPAGFEDLEHPDWVWIEF
jgi:transposase InsO family protein